MSTRIQLLTACAVAVTVTACDPPKETAAEAASSTTAAEEVPQQPTPTATATAEAPKPSHPCPEGTEGQGTLKDPCAAKGTARIMEAIWTGKMDDKGPSFRVTNNAKLEVLYGNIIVYFYDKAGKQLEVPGEKPAPKVSCAGNIFAGPMKPAEKATITFSCVKKSHVPEGTAAIEAELKTVGFTSKEGNKSDTFWRNEDLVPDERPKGGIK
jgi:hypothetical protein